MSFCAPVQAAFHAQGFAGPAEGYQGSLVPPSWRSNPPHPDFALPSGNDSEVAQTHPPYLTPFANAPTPSRGSARSKSSRKEQASESAAPSGRGQSRRVARVFPRRKAGQDKRSTDTPVVLTKEMLLPLFAIPLRDAAEMMVSSKFPAL